jgi:predicted nucleic acid-binding protein
MIVVDASAWVRALVDAGPTGDAVREVMVGDAAWVAPAHAPLEVLRTIRRYETTGLIQVEQASRLADAVLAAEVTYVAAEPWLLRAAWDLRHNLSVYDAPYVALARVHDAPVVTCDERLAHAAASLGVTARLPGQ